MQDSRLVEELFPVPDPLDTCARFARVPFLIFLDSAGDRSPRGSFSYLSADPFAVVRSRGGQTDLLERPGGHWVPVSGDPLALAHARLGSSTLPVPELAPFRGMVAGHIGYEWGSALEAVPAARLNDLAVPDLLLGCYDWVLAWDHVRERAWIVSTGLPGPDGERGRRAAARLLDVKRRLAGSVRAPAPPQGAGVAPMFALTYPAPDLGGSVRSTFAREDYLRAVARVVRHIRAGDVFQANLAQRFHAPLVGSPLDLYGRLRTRNPAPFCAYFDLGDTVIASASPERFLRLEDGRAEARPIKGTRPRGSTTAQDDALREDLATSVKDRAENAMIVDVVRNDLSRVCRPGTVRAAELFAVERYATVQHLVSTVVGELADGCAVPALLRAAFPSGSVTGAPKVRAMQIIADLEPTTRGVYCGAIGYWSATGVLDLSVAIRTCVVKGGQVFFHAGGGILAESDPAWEYEETLAKARGIVAALAP